MIEMVFAPGRPRFRQAVVALIIGHRRTVVRAGYNRYNNINPSGIINRSEWDSNGILTRRQ